MKSKKGVELSANFIVMLIIAIAILAFGLVFGRNLFSAAQEMKSELDQRTQRQIESMLDDGSKVILPITTKEVKKGNTALFGFGILNINDESTNNQFLVRVSNVKGVKPDGTNPVSAPNILIDNFNDYLLYDDDFQIIERNNKETMGIAVSIPTGVESGTYSFSVYVCSGIWDPTHTFIIAPLGDCYDDSSGANVYAKHFYTTPLKFYVKVP
jgi:hypothetical protein